MTLMVVSAQNVVDQARLIGNMCKSQTSGLKRSFIRNAGSNRGRRRKRCLLLMLCMMMVISFAACEDNQNETDVKKEEVSSEEQQNSSLNEDSAEEPIVFGSVSDYFHNYKRLDGALVQVPGILVEWEGTKKLYAIDDTKGSTVDLDAKNAPDGYTEVEKNSYIVITGISHTDTSGNPNIEVQKYEAVEGLKEPYWSDTTLITDDNALAVMSATYDPTEYYECTAILTPSNVFIILGLDDLPHVQRGNLYFVNIPYNVPLQMLITDIHYDSDSTLQFNIEEVISFK